MFSFITMNWRGRPLTSLRTIIELISATTTTTTTGLTIQAGYDPHPYPKGVKISDAQLAAVPCTATSGTASGITPLLLTPNQTCRRAGAGRAIKVSALIGADARLRKT